MRQRRGVIYHVPPLPQKIQQMLRRACKDET